LLGILSIVGVGAPAASAASDVDQSIDGTLVLNDGFGNEGAPCEGSGKFADIKSGATVKMKDARKKVVGTGTLGDGTLVAAMPGSDFVNCEFPFTFPVSSSKSYAVQVGTRKAGVVSRKALVANDWILTINIS
jgi:hypothetical protein